MDILDKLLQLAQISAGVSTQCHLQGDFYLEHQAESGVAVVHLVLRGRVYVAFEGKYEAESAWLEEGELMFLPRVVAHGLQSREEGLGLLKTTSETEQRGAFRVKRFGEAGDVCDLICLQFYYEPQSELMENLPPFLRLSLVEPALQALVDLLRAEEQSALGTVTVVNGLALVWLTLMLRGYLNQGNVAVLGTLRASREPRLRALLKAILHAPEADWRIEQMAEFAHVSRSGLIRLFQEHLGERPHGFVHRVRLNQAALMLRQRSDSVLSIALATGFQSETHFGKAFKKVYGLSPRQYRLR